MIQDPKNQLLQKDLLYKLSCFSGNFVSCSALKKKKGTFTGEKKVQMPVALLETDETLWLLDFSGISENSCQIGISSVEKVFIPY